MNLHCFWPRWRTTWIVCLSSWNGMLMSTFALMCVFIPRFTHPHSLYISLRHCVCALQYAQHETAMEWAANNGFTEIIDLFMKHSPSGWIVSLCHETCVYLSSIHTTHFSSQRFSLSSPFLSLPFCLLVFFLSWSIDNWQTSLSTSHFSCVSTSWGKICIWAKIWNYMWD